MKIQLNLENNSESYLLRSLLYIFIAIISPMATAKKPTVPQIQFNEDFNTTINTIATSNSVATSFHIRKPVDDHL